MNRPTEAVFNGVVLARADTAGSNRSYGTSSHEGQGGLPADPDLDAVASPGRRRQRL